MSDNLDNETDDAAAPTPQNGKRKLLLIGVGSALLAIVVAAVLYVVFGTKSNEPTMEYVDMSDLVVNMKTADGRPRFLKIKIVLEVAGQDGVKAVEARKPRIVDSFQTFLREVRPEDLNGASGSFRIKEELLVRANQAVAPARVADVLIQELVQQ